MSLLKQLVTLNEMKQFESKKPDSKKKSKSEPTDVKSFWDDVCSGIYSSSVMGWGVDSTKGTMDGAYKVELSADNQNTDDDVSATITQKEGSNFVHIKIMSGKTKVTDNDYGKRTLKTRQDMVDLISSIVDDALFDAEDDDLLEAVLKAYKVKIQPQYQHLLAMSDKDKEDVIFGDNEGDDSFIQNQSIVTVESISVKGNTVYIEPYWSDDYETTDAKTQKKLQSAFNDWCEENYSEEMFEAVKGNWRIGNLNGWIKTFKDEDSPEAKRWMRDDSFPPQPRKPLSDAEKRQRQWDKEDRAEERKARAEERARKKAITDDVILDQADEALAYAMDGGDPIDKIGDWMKDNDVRMDRINKVVNKAHKLKGGLYAYIAQAWSDMQADRIHDAEMDLKKGKKHKIDSYDHDDQFYRIKDGKVVPEDNPWGSPK